MAVVGALGYGGFLLFTGARTRLISVCVATDVEYRQEKPNWEASLTPLFKEVNHFFEKTGVQWQFSSGGEAYPPQKQATLSDRAELLQLAPPCKADVVLALTGHIDHGAESVVAPFTHIVLVSDTAANPDVMTAIIVARTLGKLFGVPGSTHAMILTDTPADEIFDAGSIKLIHRLRDYNFAAGIDAMSGRWEKRVVSALAETLTGRSPHPESEAHRDLARAFSANRRHDDAARELREAVLGDPENNRLRLELAMALESASRSQDAIAELRNIARRDPEDAKPHATIGAIYLNAQRVDEAIAELRIATRLAPKNPGYATAYGIALSRQPGRTREALAAFQTAYKLKPDEEGAFAGLEAQSQSERESQAEASQLQEAVRKNPSSADAHLKLGLAFGFAGDANAAQREVQRALDLQPNNGQAHLTMARLHYLTGDYVAADRELTAATAAGFTPRADFANSVKRKLADPSTR